MTTTSHPETESAARPEAQLMQMLTGAWVTQMVAAVCRLGLPDRLSDGSKTARDLAPAARADADSVDRVMHALASIGVFRETAPGHYALTPTSERLRAGAPGSMRDLFLAETDEVHRRSWDHLVDALRSGQPQPQPVLGMPAFEYYGTHVDDGEQFGRAMANVSAMAAEAVLAHYDFAGAGECVDVGGGNGSFVRAILQRYPAARGVIFDLPYIAQQAADSIRSSGLAGRCRFQAGDFFDEVPAGADRYLLRFVLHDWDDDSSIRLLGRCRAAIAPTGRLLIVEMLIPEHNEPGLAQMMDINMLVVTGGRERTASGYGRLLERAGFRLLQVVTTDSPFSIIEAEPS